MTLPDHLPWRPEPEPPPGNPVPEASPEDVAHAKIRRAVDDLRALGFGRERRG